MKKNNVVSALFISALMFFTQSGQAQQAEASNALGADERMVTEKASETSTEQKTSPKLRIGGYGEATYTRNFYSDNVYRYVNASKYKNDPSHGRFDIPHAVIYLSYDFGKGWSMSSEIEFEHGGTGGAIEQEYEEAGEWEQETEKGGEVELEQFYLQKTISPAFNIRAGHLVVPIGLTNAHHEPIQFFTVYRPEGEATILPCTWHQTGISLWGKVKDWRYEVQLVSGLDAFMFSRDKWIQKGATSPYEFEVSNKYGLVARIDNYSVKGLRMAVSGYYGNSMHNTLPHDLEGEDESGNKKKYDGIKGRVMIGSFDFTYNDYNMIIRGNFDYGSLNDASTISTIKKNLTSNNAPYDKTPVGKNAISTGLEAGYDLFSQVDKLHRDNQKLYLFGRYEYYDSYMPASDQAEYKYTARNRMAVGLNYFPMSQIVVKAEFSKRFLKSQYNDEPSISFGVAYTGFFTK